MTDTRKGQRRPDLERTKAPPTERKYAMTAQAVEVQKRLNDEEFEAKRQSYCTYVEQLEQADRQADKGWVQRAADVTDLYEDDHWVEEMRFHKPIPEKRRPGQNKINERTRERFYEWAAWRVTSPTTGRPARPAVTGELLDLQLVLRAGPGDQAGLEASRRSLKPLISFVKNDRHDEVPEVLRRAQKLAEDGQPLDEGDVKQAIAEHNRTLKSKPQVSKLTIDSYANRIRRDWDFYVRHAEPEQCKALHRELAERYKQEVQWAKGKAWTA
jgi:hypothetical protein